VDTRGIFRNYIQRDDAVTWKRKRHPPSPRTDPDAYPHKAGLIAKLYQSCQKAWKLIIDDNVLTDVEEMHMARNEAGRFNIWGDGFGAGDGGLDELLDGLETMQETIVVLIARVAQKLLQCVFI
jgi:hypothetical protein